MCQVTPVLFLLQLFLASFRSLASFSPNKPHWDDCRNVPWFPATIAYPTTPIPCTPERYYTLYLKKKGKNL